MATHFSPCLRATTRATLIPSQKNNLPLVVLLEQSARRSSGGSGGSGSRNNRGGTRLRIVRVSSVGGTDSSNSYLDMWKKAVDREKDELEFQKIVENSEKIDQGTESSIDPETLEKKSSEFEKILEVSKEERDRIQRMQVIDRASAAIAAAQAILKETVGRRKESEDGLKRENLKSESDGEIEVQKEGGMQNGSLFVSQSEISSKGTPGPDFWSWTPPMTVSDGVNDTLTAKKSSPYTTRPNPVMEKEWPAGFLPIPFETKLSERILSPPLPPLQSFMEVVKVESSSSSLETPSLQDGHELGVQFSAHAAAAAHALEQLDEAPSWGEFPDGSRWWKETGIEQRPDGVICKWTLIRGVSVDLAVEWEEKFWEAADEFDFKELGSEKLGRDALGNVWREYWKESMWQAEGLLHFEKTADKWGKNGTGDEWQEKWWEQYNASGLAEKWAHKWSSIDPNTQLEAGHAHAWHERWGEKYDGRGGSVKYTDKWAERSEGDGWSKWGDKWDEHFDFNGHGVKQGETWWEGKYGEKWNRTWGEGHNGTGWVHKYGKSSSGEHWDTHEEQETWYERYPHYGFNHCFENSIQLREVQVPSERSRNINTEKNITPIPLADTGSEKNITPIPLADAE